MANSPLHQSTTGAQSPVINTDGDVSVKYGLSKDEHRSLLQEELKKFAGQMQSAAGDEKERQLLEQKLQAVQEKLANIQNSYEEELQRRKAADEALGELKGQLPDEQIKQAKVSLEQGNTKAAEEAFDAVVDREGERVALAAFQSGQLAEGRLDYAKAMRQYKKAVVLEEDNPDYLLAAGRLARTLAEYEQSLEWLKRLLRIREAEEKGSIDFASAQNELANLFQQQGSYEEAEPLYQRSLVSFEQFFGADHPMVATALNNLATLYDDQGRYREAEPLHLRSLAIREKIFGREHTELAYSLNNLAQLYATQNRYEEAELLYKRSLTIREKIFGENHPEVAVSLNNIAELYRQQSRYAEAELLYFRSLVIMETIYGKNHHYAAAILNNITLQYKAQGRYDESEPLYKRVLQIWEQSLGNGHPNVGICLNNLAQLYSVQGRFREAAPLYKRCLSIFKAIFPAGHPYIDSSQESYEELKGKMAEQL